MADKRLPSDEKPNTGRQEIEDIFEAAKSRLNMREPTPEEKQGAEEKEKERHREESKAAIKWWVNLPVENERRLKEHERAHKEEAERKRHDASERGRHPKRREVIYKAIPEYLETNRAATNNEVWNSFPEGREDTRTVGDLRYSVFRDGADCYQNDSGGKTDRLLSISRKVFDGYVTRARDELQISTRRKKRS